MMMYCLCFLPFTRSAGGAGLLTLLIQRLKHELQVQFCNSMGKFCLDLCLFPMCVLQLKQEQADYEEAVTKGPTIKAGEPFDIGMRVILVHGDEVM